MNREQARYLANQLTGFLQGTTSTIGVGGIITELEAQRADTLAVIAAAWTTVYKIRAGVYQSFAMLAGEVAALVSAGSTPPSPPAARPPAPATSPEPCPAHFWAPANNCGACWSEIKTGHRPASAYGLKTWHPGQEPTGPGVRPSEAPQGPARAEGSR